MMELQVPFFTMSACEHDMILQSSLSLWYA